MQQWNSAKTIEMICSIANLLLRLFLQIKLSTSLFRKERKWMLKA